MTEPYLLGHDDQEWARLDDQHALWRDVLLEDVISAGLRPGMSVLDAGCGVGSFLADLAAVVGGEGDAAGLERDRGACEVARRRFRAHANVRLIHGDLLSSPLPTNLDMVVCRWVLSFVPDVDLAVSRLAACLKPGGVLVVQDYDHDGVNLFPRLEGFSEVVEAFRTAYRDSGGDLYVATRLPRLYQAQGLEAVQVHPHAMASLPGGGAWRWVARFLREHIGDLVDSGHLEETAANSFMAGLDAAESDPGALMVTPLVLTVTGQKPS